MPRRKSSHYRCGEEQPFVLPDEVKRATYTVRLCNAMALIDPAYANGLVAVQLPIAC